MVGLVAAPVEVVLIDDAGRDRLVLLPEIEQQRVRYRCEDMRDDVDLASLDQAQTVGDGFRERGRVASAQYAALARTQREFDQPPDLRQRREAIGACGGHSSRKFRTLFRQNSAHNSFLVTERCNNYCLMCSQPPKDVDDRWILSEIKESLSLIDPTTHALTFTGGETLSDWQDFIAVLKECRDRLPMTAIQVLTNGRAFADSQIVDAWKNIGHPNLMAAIPVYASVDHIHDHVVQAKGAFDETVLGILKLKDRGQRVEIRVVLHALTGPIIEETGRWIARNLPFVDHVALMGLENTGFAIANDALLWMDPVDYADGLAKAVDHLSAAGVHVSVYNLPKCVLPKSIWPYALQSISDWKNGFVEECGRCDEKNTCSGFFTTGRPRFSRGVRAITSHVKAATLTN